MSTTTRLTAPEEIEYPESDGEPIAENTEQLSLESSLHKVLESYSSPSGLGRESPAGV